MDGTIFVLAALPLMVSVALVLASFQWQHIASFAISFALFVMFALLLNAAQEIEILLYIPGTVIFGIGTIVSAIGVFSQEEIQKYSPAATIGFASFFILGMLQVPLLLSLIIVIAGVILFYLGKSLSHNGRD